MLFGAQNNNLSLKRQASSVADGIPPHKQTFLGDDNISAPGNFGSPPPYSASAEYNIQASTGIKPTRAAPPPPNQAVLGSKANEATRYSSEIGQDPSVSSRSSLSQPQARVNSPSRVNFPHILRPTEAPPPPPVPDNPQAGQPSSPEVEQQTRRPLPPLPPPASLKPKLGQQPPSPAAPQAGPPAAPPLPPPASPTTGQQAGNVDRGALLSEIRERPQLKKVPDNEKKDASSPIISDSAKYNTPDSPIAGLRDGDMVNKAYAENKAKETSNTEYDPEWD